MHYVAIVVHGFLGVLLVGTMFRLVSYHLVSSTNEQLQHLGKAMSVQY